MEAKLCRPQGLRTYKDLQRGDLFMAPGEGSTIVYMRILGGDIGHIAVARLEYPTPIVGEMYDEWDPSTQVLLLEQSEVLRLEVKGME